MPGLTRTAIPPLNEEQPGADGVIVGPADSDDHAPAEGRIQRGRWVETLVVSGVSALLLLVMALPAFRSYFFGENFLYLGAYEDLGRDYLRTVLSPSDGIFFRPVFVAASLPWFFVLPPDPVAYHLRNFAFSVLNVAVLHRVLLRLVASRTARVLAVLFFAISKVHLTTIGYINIFDSTMMLLLLLLTLLFFLRHRQDGHARDYGLGLLFGGFSVFSKDYGLAVAGVLGAMALGLEAGHPDWQARARWWAVRLAPLGLVVAVYFGARAAAHLAPIPPDSVYSPRWVWDVAAHKVAMLVATAANLALPDGSDAGAGGLAAWLAAGVPRLPPPVAAWADALLLAPFLGLMAWTAVVTWRRVGWWALFPVAWVGAYFVPGLLIRNVQMYYLYEPLAGMAVLLGLCLDRAGRRLVGVWAVALVVIGLNGAASNYRSLYPWQYTADRVQQVDAALTGASRGGSITSLTFLTDSRLFWQFALTQPMLRELLGNRQLQVGFADDSDLPSLQRGEDPGHLIVQVDDGFTTSRVGSDSNLVARPDQSPPVLLRVSPKTARAGAAFNPQASGDSAISVDAEDATPDTTIVFADKTLATTYGSRSWLTALVPRDLLARPGSYSVYLRNGLGESNHVEFVITP